MQSKDWTIHLRYMPNAQQGWKVENRSFVGTLTEAHYAASEAARELDALYGDGHFWTVNIYNPAAPENGSAVELFHGRLI